MARTTTSAATLTPVGEYEIATIIRNRATDEQIARGTIAMWRERYRGDFPAVAFRVGRSPGWFFEQIEQWFYASGRDARCYIDEAALAEVREAVASTVADLGVTLTAD